MRTLKNFYKEEDFATAFFISYPTVEEAEKIVKIANELLKEYVEKHNIKDKPEEPEGPPFHDPLYA